MTLLRRSPGPERMDAPDLDRDTLEASLRHVAAVDRWLGGDRSLRRHLQPLVEGRPGGRILDVGTGNGQMLRRTVGWARQVGGPGWTGVGLDVHAGVLDAARRAGGSRTPMLRTPTGASRAPGPSGGSGGAGASDDILLLRGAASTLPLADASVDVALTVLTLHHFASDQAVAVLREMRRVARSAVLVSDLQRSLLHYLGARVLAATWWISNPVTRHDGPLSVRRSFTAPELEALGKQAGLRQVRVRRHPVFRLVLEGRP